MKIKEEEDSINSFFEILPSEITNDKKYYIACFPFLEDFQLCAKVDIKNGKQKIIIDYIQNNQIIDYTSIDCVHTAITDITPEEYEKIKNNQEEEFKLLKIKSTENLKKINLTPEEHFFALKSFIQNIAEIGLDFFNFQNNVKIYFDLVKPLIIKILHFIIIYKKEYTNILMNLILEDCMYENEIHASSFIANLLYIADRLSKEEFILRLKDYYSLLIKSKNKRLLHRASIINFMMNNYNNRKMLNNIF